MDKIYDPVVFDVAINLLKLDGWGRGHLLSETGHRCAWGALIDAINMVEEKPALVVQENPRVPPSCQIYDAAMRIALDLKGFTDDIPEWNDNPVRTRKDVIEILADAKWVMGTDSFVKEFEAEGWRKIDADIEVQLVVDSVIQRSAIITS